MLLFLTLVLAQDVERITAKDPRASFEAISRLVDLPRADVEKAAARLPDDVAFYRKVLLEELKTRDKLGERFGREIRVSLDLKDVSPDAAIDALTKQAPLFVWRSEPGDGITLKIDDALCMDALSRIAAAANKTVSCDGNSMYDGRTIRIGGAVDARRSFQYRNFLVHIAYLGRAWSAEFGGRATRSIEFLFNVMWDSGVIVARPDPHAEFIEAIDDKGRAVEGVPPEAHADWDGRHLYNAGNFNYTGLRVAWPRPDAKALSRVRGAVTVLVPLETSRFKFDAGALKGRVESDDHIQATWVSLNSVADEIVLRIKPKAPLKDFARWPVEFTLAMDTGEELPSFGYGTVIESEIEYRLRPPRLHLGKGKVPSVTAVTVLVHRVAAPRKVYFEFRDLPLE